MLRSKEKRVKKCKSTIKKIYRNKELLLPSLFSSLFSSPCKRRVKIGRRRGGLH